MSVFVDIHVLQTLPPSNPNRDDMCSEDRHLWRSPAYADLIAGHQACDA